MRRNLCVVAAIWFFSIANYCDRTVIAFAGPSIMTGLHIGAESFGTILALFAIGYGIAQLPGGLIADRWNPRILLIFAPLLWALFTGISGLASSAIALGIMRLCLGLSEALSNAAGVKVIGDTFAQRDRALAFGIVSTALALAPAIIGPIVGLLLASHGWRFVFLLMVAPPLIASLFNYAWIPRGNPRSAAAARPVDLPKMRLADIFRLRTLWLVSGVWFMFYVAFSGYLGWMPSYLLLERHLDVKAGGGFAGLPYLFGALGLTLTGIIGTRWLENRRPEMLATCYFFAAIALWLAYRASSIIECEVWLCFAAFCLYSTIALFSTVALDIAPEACRGTFWGIISSIGQIGAAVAPYLIGFFVGRAHNFAGAFGMMSGSLFFAAILSLVLVVLRLKRSIADPSAAIHREASDSV